MAKRQAQPRPKSSQIPWIHSTRVQLVMYSFLLVATPFILLRAFLQDALGRFSASRVPLGGLEIPLVPSVILLLALTLIVVLRRLITVRFLSGVLLALVMITLAQQITDFYFDHNFYDLQQNWHYIAYAIFAFMVRRDLVPRGLAPARIMLITFCAAMLFSTFDEGFQWFLSSRIFDAGDIAKDIWGAMIGITLINVGVTGELACREAWRELRQPALKAYLHRPASLYTLLFAFGLILICVSALLTNTEYLLQVILISGGCFLFFFVLFHLSQYRPVKFALWGAALLLLVVQGFFFVRHRGDQVVHNSHGLIVYKGIPIPFFDVMIYPNGLFRPVDKKHMFNSRDRTFLLRREVDIILIGSGTKGRGGKGFPEKAVSQFIYNANLQRGTQVIILRTAEACQEFVRLKREGKNVLFILHSTC